MISAIRYGLTKTPLSQKSFALRIKKENYYNLKILLDVYDKPLHFIFQG